MGEEQINVAGIREEYTRDVLNEDSLQKDPILQFERWFEEALHAKVWEPNAMVLATISQDHRPTSRVVLLKGFDPTGFVFFTNYQSDKGQQLLGNPHASLLFFWPELQRQVRIEGEVTRIAEEESDAYFASRPRSSQIGALASPQSEIVPSRTFLDDRLQELTDKYADPAVSIPRPAHWGGFCLKPDRVEFWQGRANRLHDRVVYKREAEGIDWRIMRLAP